MRRRDRAEASHEGPITRRADDGQPVRPRRIRGERLLGEAGNEEAVEADDLLDRVPGVDRLEIRFGASVYETRMTRSGAAAAISADSSGNDTRRAG